MWWSCRSQGILQLQRTSVLQGGGSRTDDSEAVDEDLHPQDHHLEAGEEVEGHAGRPFAAPETEDLPPVWPTKGESHWPQSLQKDQGDVLRGVRPKGQDCGAVADREERGHHNSSTFKILGGGGRERDRLLCVYIYVCVYIIYCFLILYIYVAFWFAVFVCVFSK